MPKAIKSKTRIPTPVGIILLVIALTLGVVVYFYQDSKSTQRRNAFSPKNIEVINITDKSATITWRTDVNTRGEIILDINNEAKKHFLDDRDRISTKERNTHYVTLQNLSPQSRYFFKVRDGNEEYFDAKTQAFKTAKSLATQNLKQTIKPLTGAVVDDNLNPIEGALVFLNINGASRVGTFTNSEGNFILPTKPLLTEDLSNFYSIEDNTNASLLLRKDQLSSIVEFTFPVKNSSFQTLPIGRNINLRDYLASTPEVVNNLNTKKVINYDLNGDGKINSVDLSIFVDNFGKRFNNSQMDFNFDGEVDQKDLELFLKAVPD